MAGFPKHPKVYHFHPGGLAGNFYGCGCECINVNMFMEKYRSAHGDFDGAPGKKLDPTSEKNLRDLVEGILDYNQKRNKACSIYETAYMLATAARDVKDRYLLPTKHGIRFSQLLRQVRPGLCEHRGRSAERAETRELAGR